MSRQTGFNALITLAIVGAGGGGLYALNRFSANEAITAGAPQQTVAALWAVMDLLVALIGVGVVLVWTVAWHGLSQPDRQVPTAQ